MISRLAEISAGDDPSRDSPETSFKREGTSEQEARKIDATTSGSVNTRRIRATCTLRSFMVERMVRDFENRSKKPRTPLRISFSRMTAGATAW